MFSLPNALSFLRAPLAFVFLFENPMLRVGAIFFAMITDSIDGYLARRTRTTSQFGAILDPATDKFFVYFALIVMLLEGKLLVWQACAMISRDFFLCVFAIYLGLSGHWQAYKCKAIRWGKITTALQFLVLIGLALSVTFPWYVYSLFILFGVLAFIELCQIKKNKSTAKN
jgi:CDP-diacylglycerol--glycerol-3-phosphate 3-phosphatidyltransferase